MSMLEALSEIVGDKYTMGPQELRNHAQDYWNTAPTRAFGRVRPGTVDEVAAVLGLCNRLGCPVVPEGGRTNLVHGTYANPDSLLLSLDRLNQIDEPDAGAMTISAGAGAVVQAIQETCARDSLRFGLDFGARGSATLGGALSTNAGGVQALRYGVARDQVLGLECVLADGTVLSHLSAFRKDNTGYDLKQLFIGAEGTLGIITRAVLQLHPAPVTTQTALLAFTDFTSVTRTLSRLRRDLRGTLSAFEIMWAEFFDFNVDAIGSARPFESQYSCYVLCEAEGFDPAADEEMFEGTIAAALEADEVADAIIAQSSRQREDIWQIRENFDAEQELFSVMIDFDVTLPLKVMEPFVSDVAATLRRDFPEALGLHVIGHIGDGNLHITTGLPTDTRADRVRGSIYSLISNYNGSISAEHGIGLAKRDYLGLSRSPEEIALMRRIRHTLDPRGILNPGKVFKG